MGWLEYRAGYKTGYPGPDKPHRQEDEMPWVRRHRRSAPYSFFRTTTVRSHYRKPAGFKWIIVAIAIVLIVLLIALF